MPIKWDAPKDPEEVKDYDFDWSPLLVDGDTLLTVTWSIPSPGATGPLEIESSSIDDTNTVSTVWFSGGAVANSPISVKALATTSGGRTYDQTLVLKIKEK